MNRTERLTAILLLLQEKPATAAAIARRFEISRRTVMRDIQALSEMGVPVIAREGPGGGYSLPADFTLDPLALTANEAFLLLLAVNTLNQLSDAPFSAERVSLTAKLRALLPPRMTAEQISALDRLLQKVEVPAPPRPQRAPFLDPLIAAMKDQRWLRIRYRSADGESSVRIQPREVSSQNGYWYCLAYALERQAQRTYRVDRILALEALPADFCAGPLAEALPYEHPSHPRIRAELTPRGALLVEIEPHLSQALRRNLDGSAQLELRCPPGELDYYARYFASLGAEALVHEPPELLLRLAALGQRLAEQYGKFVPSPEKQ